MVAFLSVALLWAIALLSLYLYQSSDHEVMKVLAGFAATVCIIWGFAATHWGLHLVCLLVLMRYRFPLQLKPIAVDKF
jgi:hypothetical protein